MNYLSPIPPGLVTLAGDVNGQPGLARHHQRFVAEEAGFALGKPTFQLLPFVGLQHGEPPFFRAMERAPPVLILSSFLIKFSSISQPDG